MRKALIILNSKQRNIEARKLRKLLWKRKFEGKIKNFDLAYLDTHLYFDIIFLISDKVLGEKTKILVRRAQERRIPLLLITTKWDTKIVRELAWQFRNTFYVYKAIPSSSKDFENLWNTVGRIFRLRRKAQWRKKEKEKIFGKFAKFFGAFWT